MLWKVGHCGSLLTSPVLGAFFFFSRNSPEQQDIGETVHPSRACVSVFPQLSCTAGLLLFSHFVIPHVCCAGSFLFQGLSVPLPPGAHCALHCCSFFGWTSEVLEDYRFCQADKVFFAKTLMGVQSTSCSVTPGDCGGARDHRSDGRDSGCPAFWCLLHSREGEPEYKQTSIVWLLILSLVTVKTIWKLDTNQALMMEYLLPSQQMCILSVPGFACVL